jgi:hypothetical protein
MKTDTIDPKYLHGAGAGWMEEHNKTNHESSCRKCNSTEIDTVVAKQREEIKKLESKNKYLIPYCFECGAEYEDQSCCPDKSISYIHPSFLKELKEAEFGVQRFRS